MSTLVYLVRHAAHALLDRVLVGRAAVELSGLGVQQAQALGRRFAGQCIASVESSPQPRARQTAEPIAEAVGVAVEIAPAVDELDMGAWTGRSFEDLNNDPQWHRWNTERGSSRPPGGESMWDVQNRMLRHLEWVHARYTDQSVVIVSHAEPLRAALLHYLNIPLNDFMKVWIAPASLNPILLSGNAGEITGRKTHIEGFAAA